MAFSVGIGLTNECNLRCPHCYRPDRAVARLTLADVRRVCEALPGRSMNLGVGANGLPPSTGLSLEALPDDALKRFHSVECSLDFPTEPAHDAFRGRGNWRAVAGALERCGVLGVPVTVTAVMMSVNHDRLDALARVAAGFGCDLRVNVYQPSRTDRFTLSYAQFWEGFRRPLRGGRPAARTEPAL